MLNSRPEHASINWTSRTYFNAVQASGDPPVLTSDPEDANNDHRSSTVSFAAYNHIRHHRHSPIHGTWRTRMKRTKCWRCELEARHKASAETMHRFFDRASWQHKWHSTKAKLRWSCFCRYKAYEEEEGESHRETQARVRLGRFGRVLQ
jgi:hypothetical protein